VVLKSFVFWDRTPCSPLKVNRRFGEIYRLHIQGRRISQERNQYEAGSSSTSFFDPEDEDHIFFRNVG
jgi:hypothetical protein